MDAAALAPMVTYHMRWRGSAWLYSEVKSKWSAWTVRAKSGTSFDLAIKATMATALFWGCQLFES